MTTVDTQVEEFKPLVKRLEKDIRLASKILGPQELRFLVETYYAMQEHRIREEGRIRAATDSVEPFDVMQFLFQNMEVLEHQVKASLKVFSKEDPFCRWATSLIGIGPVIACGLRAHIDIEKAKYAGQVWRFAGLDPTSVWNKGEKRPYNAKLKVLCWKVGDSFVKFSNHENCYYGKLYKKRKALEVHRNEAGEFKEHAAKALAGKKWDKTTEAYKAYTSGKLPPGHIDARARRVVVKLFLSHVHDAMHRLRYGTPAPKPYALAYLPDHTDFHEIPNLDALESIMATLKKD